MDDAAMKHMALNFAKLDKFEGNVKSSKELWDSLEAKYMAEDASSKRFTQHSMNMDEAIQEELTLVELGSHLRIENSLRMQDSDKPKGNKVVGPLVVNMVEHNNSSTYNDNKSKRGKVSNKANGSAINGSMDGSTNSLKAFMSTSKLNDSILWHVRLGHVHFKRMQDMFKEGLILDFDMDTGKTRDEVSDQHSYCFNVKNDPKTFDEAMKSQDVVFWKKEINDEMDSIMGNNTWVLADLPLGFKSLGCKWIFKIKLKVDGTIKKFNVRMFIQGFKQKLRIDYFDTYALVARISTIRLLIAMTSIHNLIIHQMDVMTPFLNGDLDEEVYMNQPRGFIMPGNGKK
nr:zinc finger, CCHC-type [Tanacetum cinerariifolium]